MAEERATRRLVIALIVGGIMPVVDTTIVAIGLDRIGEDLGADVATLQWVSTVYLLALAVVIPVAGWVQARLGDRNAWILASGIFLAASVLCASASGIGELIAFRALQGAGAGLLLPLLQTLPMQRAPREAMARTMAVMSVPISLGPVIGPVLGGLVLSSLDWRWLFLINLPLGAVGLLLAALWLPGGRSGARTTLDVIGLLLLAPGLVGVLLALSNLAGGTGAGEVAVWVPAVTGLVLLVAFVPWTLGRRDPLVDLRLLGVRSLRASTVAMAFSGANLYAATFLLPLALQTDRGVSVLEAALLLIPQGVGSLLARAGAGRLVARGGPRAVAISGFALVAVMTVPFALDDGTLALAVWAVVLFVRGLGLGVVLVPIMASGYLDVAPDRMPHASAFSRMAQQLGGAFGTATAALVLAAVTTASGTRAGFDAAFVVVIGICAAAMAASLALPGRRGVVR